MVAGDGREGNIVELSDWQNVSEDFWDTLVLGNGASVAVHEKFRYSSLKEEARERGYLSAAHGNGDDSDAHASGPVDAEGVFELLETDDFEVVLNLLWHARYVNERLSVEEEETEAAYELVRDALVKTVHAVHCERNEIEEQLQAIYRFMGRFGIVLSLNYDLIVYWALLAGIGPNPGRFMDCFLGDRTFDPDWARHLSSGSKASRPTLVFYPHGNLLLTTNLLEGERKVFAKSHYISQQIGNAWRGGRTPLFVSEGRPQDKENKIKKSGYLRTVYGEVMGNLGATVVIYGWDFSYEKKKDTHLLKRLFEKRKDKVAVSVYRPRLDGDEEALELHCRSIENDIKRAASRAGFRRPEVLFFDAESEGCWIHRAASP
ncbi:MAG: DUF4917 family protein [Actinomycetota bacterium]|nr:DUF4917 family protein [Actinomycetota bacterium]